MYENRRINTESRQKIDELMNQISGYSNIKTSLIMEKERTSKFSNQINFYEKELKILEGKIKDISEKAGQKIKQVVIAEKEVREKKDKATFLLNDLTVELDKKKKEVQGLTKELSTQLMVIKKLMLSIDNIEGRIEK